MADEKKDQQLDAMLDEMLAGYSAAEPGPGFEQRLVATLRAKPERRWYETSGFSWAMIAAAAAIVIIAGYLFWPRAVPEPRQAKQHQQPSLPMPQPSTQSVQPAPNARNAPPKHEVIHRLRAVIAKAAVPKLETFPSPAPLSHEEKLLMSYVARTPRQELIAQSRPDEPMELDGNESLPDKYQSSDTRRNRR